MSDKVTKEELNKEYIRKQIRLNTELNDIGKRIGRIDLTLNDLQFKQQESIYRTTQIGKYKEKKEKSVYRLKEIENELSQVITRNLDEEIKQELLSRKCESTKNRINEKEAKALKSKIKSDKREQSQNRWKQRCKQDRKERYRNGGQRDYYYYLKLCNSLPSYMERNLSCMPNNKGYIFRGVWFLGEKPAERGKNMILFEKKRNILYIHEISKTEHIISEKRGKKEKKKEISRTLRKKKKEVANNLMDFVKK
jgi:hypothetical protein